MLKISTRLFAASTLAAMLICVNQGAFAAEKTAKTVAKQSARSAVKVAAKTEEKCAMCVGESATLAKVAAKTGKPIAKTVSAAKIAPPAIPAKVATKTGTAAEKSCPMCAKEAAKTKI